MLFWLVLLDLLGPYQDLPRVALSWRGEPGWYPYLTASLGETGLALFPLPPEVQDPNEWGRRNHIDLIAYLSAEPQGEGITIHYSLVETVSGDVLSEGQWEAPAPSFRALAEAFWIPFIEEFHRTLRELRGTQIRLRAAPGTRIQGLGNEEAVIGESGEVSFTLRTPATYPFRAVHPNLRPVRGVLAALRNGQVFEIPQHPSRRFSFVLGSVMFSFPYLEARYHFFYDHFWVGLGLEQYLLGSGLRLSEGPLLTPADFIDPKFLIPYFSIGGFVDPPDAFLRSFLGLEFGLRIRTALGDLDPVGRLQTSFNLGIDWKFWEEFRLQLALKLRNLFLRDDVVPMQWYFPNFTTFQVTAPTDYGGIQIPLLLAGVNWSF